MIIFIDYANLLFGQTSLEHIYKDIDAHYFTKR